MSMYILKVYAVAAIVGLVLATTILKDEDSLPFLVKWFLCTIFSSLFVDLLVHMVKDIFL